MKKTLLLLIYLLLSNNLHAREIINANFNNLSLNNIIKITSKIINKNILISTKITGKVDFISNKPIYKDEVLDLLKTILESKGFEIVEKNNILNIVSINNKENIKVVYLKNTKASAILEIIKNLKVSTQDTNSVKIAQFKDTNAIVLKGQKEKISPFIKLIEELDVAKQQVYVQAKIIEISEKKTQNIGIEYGLNGFDTSGSGIMTFASSLNSSQINNALSLEQLSGYGYSPNNLQ
ncbi:MAG: hypothetical protein WBG69_00045, partial [Arcobacteraceae bacterium]